MFSLPTSLQNEMDSLKAITASMFGVPASYLNGNSLKVVPVTETF
jgi:hypothetical protein